MDFSGISSATRFLNPRTSQNIGISVEMSRLRLHPLMEMGISIHPAECSCMHARKLWNFHNYENFIATGFP